MERDYGETSVDMERDYGVTPVDSDFLPVDDPDLLAEAILMEAARAEEKASPINVTIPPGKVEYIKDMTAKNAETLERAKKHICNENNCFRNSIIRLTKKFDETVQKFRLLKSQLRTGDMTLSIAAERACLVHAFQSMCLAKMAVDNYDPKPRRFGGDVTKTLDGREVSYTELEKMYSGNGQKVPTMQWCGLDSSDPVFSARLRQQREQKKMLLYRCGSDSSVSTNASEPPKVAKPDQPDFGKGGVARTFPCVDCKKEFSTSGNPYTNGRLTCGCKVSDLLDRITEEGKKAQDVLAKKNAEIARKNVIKARLRRQGCVNIFETLNGRINN